ncbi:MAG: DUF885 family protein [Bacteroidetes bacterium]|nr:DUF885 family protein [Bacteroidota bacterium]
MKTRTLPLLLAALLFGASCSTAPVKLDMATKTHADLVAFFEAWRDYRVPPPKEGVPDFSAEAIAAQWDAFPRWRATLDAFPISSWSVSEQVDWHLVNAELNGLRFDHEVLKPWERDPAYYVYFYPSDTDVPNREGPMIEGSLEVSYYEYPLADTDAAHIEAGLRIMPALYDAARVNLTGNARDLWIKGTESIREQSEALERWAARMETERPSLAEAARNARESSNAFAEWLESQADSKTGASGVGKDNMTWALKNIHYQPYTWEEEVLLVKRELARAHAALRLEENRNRALPELERISSPEEYDERYQAAINEYLAFLEEEEILPMKDYMAQALFERMGSFQPLQNPEDLRGFFSEVDYRDPLTMRTHHYHWIDLARMREEPTSSPIRDTPLWYNIFDGRAEGLATGMEEMMMHAGLFDDRPQGRELIWILLAQRGARALGGLYQHANLMTLEEAARFADQWTPRGYLPWDGSTIQHEQHFYLRQPAYGESYVIGKIEIEKLLAEYARQLGDDFSLYQFMDDLNGAGMIPVSLINWELNGDDSEIRMMTGKHPADTP